MQTTAAAGVEARTDGDSGAVNGIAVEGSTPPVIDAAGGASSGANGGGMAGEEAGPVNPEPAIDGSSTSVPASEDNSGIATVAARENATDTAGSGSGRDGSGNAMGEDYPNPDAGAKQGQEQGGDGRNGDVAGLASAPRHSDEPLKSNGQEGGVSDESTVRVASCLGERAHTEHTQKRKATVVHT